MKARLLNPSVPRVYAVVLDKGEEAVAALESFAKRESLRAAQLSGIGAFRDVVLGYFDPAARDYHRNAFAEQVEVVSLLGDVALRDEEPVLHLHAVVARRDGAAFGGHLLEGHVWPTLEVIVTVAPSYMRRRVDGETALALIEL